MMYGRVSSYYDRTEQERFWERVRRGTPQECWPWTGGVSGKGYGSFQSGSKRNGTAKKIDAHRFSYLLHKGEIPKGLNVCHTCDNPPCVNPDHLFLGTTRENALDMTRKDRWACGVRGGEMAHSSKLTLAQVEEIKRRYAAGEKQVALASVYGVRQTTISRIVRGDSWKRGNFKAIARAGAYADA